MVRCGSPRSVLDTRTEGGDQAPHEPRADMPPIPILELPHTKIWVYGRSAIVSDRFLIRSSS